jgi:hypothetical protein
MKVFVSHSSVDKWVARRIAEDLHGLGAEVFLDEKNIETGESIDASIQAHLKDSDELVMLLSPAALESPWVLIEIGGAKALGLRLVPILIHVGANQLPGPVGAYLARELNEIDVYYAEVKNRLTGARATSPKRRATTASRRRATPRAQTPSVGDRVKIAVPPSGPTTRLTDIGWMEEMAAYNDAVTTVTYVDRGERAARLAIDNEQWWWAFEWVVPYTAERA